MGYLQELVEDIHAQSKKERMPVAIQSGVTDLPMFRKTVIIALDSMTCPAVP
jgi:hypothetical protein